MAHPPSIEERVIELESRVLLQEDLLQKLNDVIVEQQERIEHLQKDLANLRNEWRESASGLDDVDEAPPHY